MKRTSSWTVRSSETSSAPRSRNSATNASTSSSGALAPEDETTWRYGFESPDDLLIVCAGGAGSWSAVLPGWGKKWTRAITTRI